MKFLASFALLAFLNQEAYRQMDEIAVKARADKGSHFHNYTEVYSQYFWPIKDLPVKMLEIGICRGRSVEFWEEYFPNGDLHFIDNTFDLLEYFPVRSAYYLADQENPKDLARVMRESGGHFDIILDDGGHTMNQQITSFRELFPHLNSGGYYIIEDLHTSYWEEYGGGDKPDTTIAFLKRLVDEVNYIGSHTKRANHLKIDPEVEKSMTSYQKEIFSIHFYDSAAVIIKR